jgi:hypothetical protein
MDLLKKAASYSPRIGKQHFATKSSKSSDVITATVGLFRIHPMPSHFPFLPADGGMGKP